MTINDNHRHKPHSRLDRVGAAIRLVMNSSDHEFHQVKDGSDSLGFLDFEGIDNSDNNFHKNSLRTSTGDRRSKVLGNSPGSKRCSSIDVFFDVFSNNDDSDDELIHHHHNYNYDHRFRMAFENINPLQRNQYTSKQSPKQHQSSDSSNTFHSLESSSSNSTSGTTRQHHFFTSFSFPQKHHTSSSSTTLESAETFSASPKSAPKSAPAAAESAIGMAVSSPGPSTSSFSSSLESPFLSSASPSTSSPTSSANSSPYSTSISKFNNIDSFQQKYILNSSSTVDDSSSFHTANGSLSNVDLFQNSAFTPTSQQHTLKNQSTRPNDTIIKSSRKKSISSLVLIPPPSLADHYGAYESASSSPTSSLNVAASPTTMEKTCNVLGGPFKRTSRNKARTYSITSLASAAYSSNTECFSPSLNKPGFSDDSSVWSFDYKSLGEPTFATLKSSPTLSPSTPSTATPRKRKTDRKSKNRLSLSETSDFATSPPHSIETLKKYSSVHLDDYPSFIKSLPSPSTKTSHKASSKVKHIKALSKSLILNHSENSPSLDQISIPYSTIPESFALPSSVPTTPKNYTASLLPPDHPLVLAAAATARTLGHKSSMPILADSATSGRANPSNLRKMSMPSLNQQQHIQQLRKNIRNTGDAGYELDTNQASSLDIPSNSKLDSELHSHSAGRSSSKPLRHRLSIASLSNLAALAHSQGSSNHPAAQNFNNDTCSISDCSKMTEISSSSSITNGKHSSGSNGKGSKGKEFESKFTPIVRLFKRKTGANENGSSSKYKFFHKSSNASQRSNTPEDNSSTMDLQSVKSEEEGRSVARKPVRKDSLLDITTILNSQPSKWEDDPLIEQYFQEADDDKESKTGNSGEDSSLKNGTQRQGSVDKASKDGCNSSRSGSGTLSTFSSALFAGKTIDEGSSSSSRNGSNNKNRYRDTEAKDRTDKLMAQRRELEQNIRGLKTEINGLRELIETNKETSRQKKQGVFKNSISSLDSPTQSTLTPSKSFHGAHNDNVEQLQRNALESTLKKKYAELEIVQRKNHEVGVLLSRAWKRRRNEGGGEFWVHSVSS